MAMRSALNRGLVIRSMESTNRGAFTRFFSDKGKVLSEEEQAKENVYIQKWEREKLEKQKQQADKVKAEKEKDVADKAENFLSYERINLLRDHVLSYLPHMVMA